MRRTPPSRRAVAVALVAVVGAALGTFAEALLGRGVFFERDILSYWYPGMVAFRRAVAEGAWPLWNPHLGFGAPLLADATFQLAYPPTWLALLLPLASYYTLFAAGHCAWAGLGVFVLGRRIGLDATAAAAGGVAFALSGPFLSAASLIHHYAGAAWMPWVLAALESALSRPRLSAALVLGVAAGSQLLAGSGDLCLATGVLGCARVGWHVLSSRLGLRPLLSLSAALLLASTLAIGLGAPQWLPTAEQVGRGSRPEQGKASTYWSLHPLSLVDLAVPRLVSGAPLVGAARQAVFEGRAPLLGGLYMGVGTLVLGVLALVAGGARARLAAVGAAFFLIASLGHHTPLYAVLSSVPGFALMRYPQKHLLGFSLCTALLTGFGVARWMACWSEEERCRAWSLAGCVALGAGVLVAAAVALASGAAPLPAVLAGALDDPRSAGAAGLRAARSALLLGGFACLVAWRATRASAPATATAALLLLGTADLVAVGRGLAPLAPKALVEHRPGLADTLLPAAPVGRVQFIPPEPDCARLSGGPPGWAYPWRAALAAVDAISPPSGVRWGLFGAFDGQFTGLEPRWSIGPIAAAVHLAGTERGTRLLEIANVGHVVWVRKEPPGALEPVETRATPYACPLQLLRVPDPLPRVYTVPRERPLPPSGDEVEALLDPSFDPRSEVLLADARPAEPGLPPPGTAHVVSRTSDTVDVESSLGGPGVLVLVEAFDEGWTADVDGTPAPVLRANLLFRAVRLGAGRHRVRFAYRPRLARLGLLLFAGSVLALGGLALVARRASIPGATEGPEQ